MRSLATLPKGHLHIHLEGAMRPSTLADMAAHYEIPVPVTRGFGSFSAFAGLYVAACEVLRTEDDLRRITREVVEDAAASGAAWVEPAFYGPRYAEQFGSAGNAIDIVLDEGLRVGLELGVGFGLMVAADRTVDPSEAVEQAKLAAERADRGVVSFGLANDEALFGPLPFAEAFAIAREAGLLSTPHAGELAGPESIVGALDALGAHRIQHGVRVVEDREVLARLVHEQVCLDVCPTSNLLLAVVPALAEHPLPYLLEQGVPCSINGDDPLLFGPGLLEEYELCRSELGLTDEQLATCARNSLVFSGAPRELVDAASVRIDEWLTEGS
jgi:adenosine deaminase